MSHPNPLSDDELNGYADRSLPPERAAAVEAALTQDPDAAARVAAIRAQNTRLAQALDPWLHEPIPARLLASATPPAKRLARWGPGLAIAASLVVGFATGWLGREALLVREGTPMTFAQQAAYAHAIYATDQGRPVEVGAQEEQRLVRWLTRRIGVQVAAPDLNPVGFALVGGRLVAGNERPTGLFMYENAEKQRLTLQWRRNDRGTNEAAFRYAVENGVGIFYWVDEHCAYALSGNLDRAQLLSVARVVYGQLAAADVKPVPR
jgi:anti-sigma factor RsiW